MFKFFQRFFKPRTPVDVGLSYFINNNHTECFIYERQDVAPKSYKDYASRDCLYKANFIFGHDSLKDTYKILKNIYNGANPEFNTYAAAIDYLDTLYILSKYDGEDQHG